MASLSLLRPFLCYKASRCNKITCRRSQREENKNGVGLGIIREVVQKDAAYIRVGFGKGLQWSNRALRIPEVLKLVDDFIWLRNVEDPAALSLQFPSWPKPFYPEFSGVDLFLADLKALQVYAVFFYHLSRMWAKPLPEIYDADLVTEYFILRPHVVAIRLIEVFTAFVSAIVKFRVSRIGFKADMDGHGNTSSNYFGMILKDTMLDLGPTFIKIGQSLSTRPDIIGHEISKALSELHDQIPPFPHSEAMKIIEEDLASPVGTYFSNFSEHPVAAASFGQVYKANTLDGFHVAVKVQRPNLHRIVYRDIYILRIGLSLLQKIAKRKNDLCLYADELGKGLIGELDYNLEAANALEFMEVHSRFAFIHVPKVIPNLTSKRVLTMEWMEGDSPNDLISLSSPESDRKLLDLVSKGVEASLVQLLETGLLHADPHPGNLRYTSKGKLGFLDFGLVCRMEKKHQYAMLSAIVHIVNGDWQSLVYDLREMDVIKAGTNLRRFTVDLEDALTELEFSNGIPDIKFSRVLGKIFSVALKYHCRLPPYYILVLRSLASLEGLAVAADPNFKTFEAAYPYVVQKLLSDNSAPLKRILYSVVLNRKQEFQWQKLAMFLRIGATRRGLQSLISSPPTTGIDPEGNLAILAMNLLTSKTGGVLRRLIMTTGGPSLIRALVSDGAGSYRKQVCRIIAGVMYEQMSRGLVKTLNLSISEFRSSEVMHDPRTSSPSDGYESFFRDRRVRVIFFKTVSTCSRKDPILLLRLCWSSLVMISVAWVMACQRILHSLGRVYLGRLSLIHSRIAMYAL